MNQHPIELLIQKADAAINNNDFDTMMGFYADDAVLVVQAGMNAVGKEQIRKAFEAIAVHFEHTLNVRQAGMEILEAEDTALVLANTIITANALPAEQRKATYVFRKDAHNNWLCVIDNSYGHDLLEVNA